jgi:hypothetical protein
VPLPRASEGRFPPHLLSPFYNNLQKQLCRAPYTFRMRKVTASNAQLQNRMVTIDTPALSIHTPLMPPFEANGVRLSLDPTLQ